MEWINLNLSNTIPGIISKAWYRKKSANSTESFFGLNSNNSIQPKKYDHFKTHLTFYWSAIFVEVTASQIFFGTHCIFWSSDISGVVAHKDLILCMVYHKEAVKWRPISPILLSHLWQDVFEIWIKEIMFVFLKGFKISNFQYDSILGSIIE